MVAKLIFTMNTETPISEIMTKDVICVQADDSLLKVEEIFSCNPIHHIMVVEDGKLVGVVSKTDMMSLYKEYAYTAEKLKASGMLIEDIMTPDPLSLEIDDTVGLAADIIMANKFHSIPVVDDGKLVGIITNHDLIKFAFSQ